MDKKKFNNLFSNVMKALLANETTLEAILDPYEYQDPARKNETLLAAFLRHKKHGLRTAPVSEDKDDGVITVLRIVNGYVELPTIGMTIPTEEFEAVLKACDRPAANRHILIPRKLSLYEIEETLKDAGMAKWGALPYPEKLNVLYQLGMDVDVGRAIEDVAIKDGGGKPREGKKDYWVDRAMYRGAGNKPEYGLVITANERTDKAWLSTGYASQEACLYTDDIELSKDLQQIGRM